MKHPIRSLACIAAVLLGPTVQAEIYQGKDADGGTVFTDSPSPGAVEVDLPEANITDPVEPSPADAPTAEKSPEATEEHTQGDNIVVIPDGRREEIERAYVEDRPHEVLDAEPRYEVGDTITPEEAKRREEAREGEYIDEDGNKIRVEHRGHVGGHR